MTAPILLTGGTGTLGRLVLPLLRVTGRPVRVLSRHRHDPGDAVDDGVEHVVGDLATGVGLRAAVDGVDVVVHCAGSAKGDEVKARTLVGAAATGVRHVVYISVVGANRVPVVSGLDRAMFGYYAAKRSAERVVAESGIGWTTLRATQFYDSIFAVIEGMAKSPLLPVPGIPFQPIDTGEVAARLVELALGEPAGLVAEMAGPTVYQMKDLVRSYLTATHRRRLLMPVPLAGRAAHALRAGAHLAPDHAVGQRTWEEFLADRLRP